MTSERNGKLFWSKYFSNTSNIVAVDFAKINITDWYSICKHFKLNGDCIPENLWLRKGWGLKMLPKEEV